MNPSTPQGGPGGVDPDDKVDETSVTHNTLSGSAAAAVQARDIDGGVTQNYHSPGRWGWTALWTCLLIMGGLLLVDAINDDQPEQRDDDAGAPLFSAVEPVTHPCSSDWFTPRAADEVRTLTQEGVLDSWTDLVDGASADHGQVLVTLQGRHEDRSVMITGIEVEVLARKPPPPGSVLDAPCGEPDTYRYVDIDLDDPRPTAVGRAVSPNALEEARANGWRVDPIVLPYEITSTDAEAFLLSASTTSCDCTWTVHFDWSSGGRTGRLTVPGDGGSFRVVSGAGASRCSTLTGQVECR